MKGLLKKIEVFNKKTVKVMLSLAMVFTIMLPNMNIIVKAEGIMPESEFTEELKSICNKVDDAADDLIVNISGTELSVTDLIYYELYGESFLEVISWFYDEESTYNETGFTKIDDTYTWRNKINDTGMLYTTIAVTLDGENVKSVYYKHWDDKDIYGEFLFETKVDMETIFGMLDEENGYVDEENLAVSYFLIDQWIVESSDGSIGQKFSWNIVSQIGTASGYDYSVVNDADPTQTWDFKIKDGKIEKIRFKEEDTTTFTLKLVESESAISVNDFYGLTKGTFVDASAPYTVKGDGNSLALVEEEMPFDIKYVCKLSNGNYIAAGVDMYPLVVVMENDEISKIKMESYGLEFLAVHEHKWVFSALNNTIKAYCSKRNDCDYQGVDNAVTLTIKSEDSIVGSAPTIKIVDNDGVEIKSDTTNKWKAASLDIPEIEYYNGEIKLNDLPTTVGTYTAKVTITAEDNTKYTATKTFYVIETNTPKLVDDDVNDLTLSFEKAVATFAEKETKESTIHIAGLNLSNFTKTDNTYKGILVTNGTTILRQGIDYTVTEGSIKINLTKAYLDTLPVGTHTITTYVRNSGTAGIPDSEHNYSFDAIITIEAKPSSGGGSSSGSSRPIYKAPNTGVR